MSKAAFNIDETEISARLTPLGQHLGSGSLRRSSHSVMVPLADRMAERGHTFMDRFGSWKVRLKRVFEGTSRSTTTGFRIRVLRPEPS